MNIYLYHIGYHIVLLCFLYLLLFLVYLQTVRRPVARNTLSVPPALRERTRDVVVSIKCWIISSHKCLFMWWKKVYVLWKGLTLSLYCNKTICQWHIVLLQLKELKHVTFLTDSKYTLTNVSINLLRTIRNW